jgi:hypothetical protein
MFSSSLVPSLLSPHSPVSSSRVSVKPLSIVQVQKNLHERQAERKRRSAVNHPIRAPIQARIPSDQVIPLVHREVGNSGKLAQSSTSCTGLLFVPPVAPSSPVRKSLLSPTIQPESNAPLSGHLDAQLVRYSSSSSSVSLEASRISERSQLSLKLKAERLAEYKNKVQTRLNERKREKQAAEERRIANLPTSVQRILYEITEDSQPNRGKTQEKSALEKTIGQLENEKENAFNQLMKMAADEENQENNSIPLNEELTVSNSQSALAASRALFDRLAKRKTQKENRLNMSKNEEIHYFRQVRQRELERERAIAMANKAKMAEKQRSSEENKVKAQLRSQGHSFGYSIPVAPADEENHEQLAFEKVHDSRNEATRMLVERRQTMRQRRSLKKKSDSNHVLRRQLQDKFKQYSHSLPPLCNCAVEANWASEALGELDQLTWPEQLQPIPLSSVFISVHKNNCEFYNREREYLKAVMSAIEQIELQNKAEGDRDNEADGPSHCSISMPR